MTRSQLQRPRRPSVEARAAEHGRRLPQAHAARARCRRSSGPGRSVCEPVVRVSLELPAATIGAVMAALARLGASVEPPSLQRDGSRRSTTVLPALRAQELQRQLPGLTGGEGVLESSFAGYQPVNGDRPIRQRASCQNRRTMKAIVNQTTGRPTPRAPRISPPTVEADERARARERSVGQSGRLAPAARRAGTSPSLVRSSPPERSISGLDVAGRVEEVGADVTRFRPGDDVFGCQRRRLRRVVRGKEEDFAVKPADVTFEQAAAVPIAGCTALQALRDHGRLQPRQRVLVNGAAGGVGTFAVQIAKALRRRGDRRVQHGECRPGALPRRRSRHRLHGRRLHSRRTAIRPRPQRRGESFVVGPPTRALTTGHARARRGRRRPRTSRRRRSPRWCNRSRRLSCPASSGQRLVSFLADVREDDLALPG